MTEFHRPHIKAKLSRWELFLIVIHVAIIIVQVRYLASRWDDIPWIILTNSHRGMNQDKYFYAYYGTFLNSSLMIVSIFFSFYVPKKGAVKGWHAQSLSHDIARAKKQYRIERSNLLCISALVHLMILINGILAMEKQIELGVAGGNFSSLPQTLIAILISWLIHHILWTKLSDK
jgi:hypothetical protein